MSSGKQRPRPGMIFIVGEEVLNVQEWSFLAQYAPYEPKNWTTPPTQDELFAAIPLAAQVHALIASPTLEQIVLDSLRAFVQSQGGRFYLFGSIVPD